jgi:hypothetical protein
VRGKRLSKPWKHFFQALECSRGGRIGGFAFGSLNPPHQANDEKSVLTLLPTDALDRGEAPAFGFDGSGMVYVYPQRSDDTTLGYTVKTTDDLVSGIWTNAGYSVIDTNVTGSTLDYVTNNVPVTDPQLFIKLEVEQN